MYVDLTTDDPGRVYKAVADATEALTTEQILRVTIERDHETGGYHMFLDSKGISTTANTDARSDEAPRSPGYTSGAPRSRGTAGTARPEQQ